MQALRYVAFDAVAWILESACMLVIFGAPLWIPAALLVWWLA
jgi:hypothetical protein